MKTARFLVVMIGLGAWTQGLSLADEPSRPLAEQNARDQPAIHVSPAGTARGGGTQADRPHSLLNGTGHGPERSRQGGPLSILPKNTLANEIHPPAFKKTPTVANQGSMMNKTASPHQEPAKLPVGSGSAPARSAVVPARSTATVSLGGRTATTAKNSAAALDGTALKRKP